jgi:hypothetical protein
LAALGVAIAVVAAGAACSAARSGAPEGTSALSVTSGSGKANQPAPTTAPAAPQLALGAPAAGAPAPAASVASDAALQRQAVSENAAGSLASQVQGSSAQPLDRMVIRTAQLGIEVGDIESALASVRQIAQQGGGFVSASNTRVEKVNDQERTVADLTIQVRSDTVDGSLSTLRALGKVTGETSGSQDVTEEYVDLDSNLRNLQASEAAVLKLMDKATRIEDVLALQRELTNIRGQIERIQGRKRFLERRTDMATIAVSLRLPTVEGSRSVLSGSWDPAAVAARGWQASLNVLRGLAEVVIIVLAFSWWLVPLAAVGFVVWQQRRRARVTPPVTPAEA